MSLTIEKSGNSINAKREKYFISAYQYPFCLILFLTRAPLGGGLFRAPLSFSCDIFQTNAGITTKLAVPSLPTILHIVWKFKVQGSIVWPQMTSEWRHVLPISTENKGLRESPPRMQF